MIYFTTRAKARAFAGGKRKLIDAGKGWGKLCWAVKVV